MKRYRSAIALLFLAALFSAHCLRAKSSKTTSQIQGPPGVTYEGGDGHDCMHAVVIVGAEGGSVEADAEAKWLEATYPGYKRIKQVVTGGISTSPKGTKVGSLHELVSITTAEGQAKDVCFGFATPTK